MENEERFTMLPPAKENTEPTGIDPHERMVWVVILVALCIGELLYWYSMTGDIVYEAPKIIGGALGGALLLWLPFYFIIMKRAVKRVGSNAPRISFFALFIASLLGNLIGVGRNRTSALDAVERIQRAVQVPDMQKQNDSSRTTHRTESYSKVSELQEIAVIAQEMNSRGELIAARERNKMDQIDLEHMLDPKRLQEDFQLRDTKMDLRRAYYALDDWKKDYEAMDTEFRDKIEHLGNSQERRDRLLKGYGEAFKASNIEAKWVFEKAGLDTINDIINLLSSSEWEGQTGKIIFKDNAVLERYNSDVLALSEIASEEYALDRITDSTQAVIERRFDSLKNILKNQ